VYTQDRLPSTNKKKKQELKILLIKFFLNKNKKCCQQITLDYWQTLQNKHRLKKWKN
jgi:hypothetical protein